MSLFPKKKVEYPFKGSAIDNLNNNFVIMAAGLKSTVLWQ